MPRYLRLKSGGRLLLQGGGALLLQEQEEPTEPTPSAVLSAGGSGAPLVGSFISPYRPARPPPAPEPEPETIEASLMFSAVWRGFAEASAIDPAEWERVRIEFEALAVELEEGFRKGGSGELLDLARDLRAFVETIGPGTQIT